MFKIAKNKKPHLCVAYACKNNKSKYDRFCSKHSKRFQKFKNPVKYTFNNKKNRAKQRGIEWGLSLEEFTEFCEENNYMELKGRRAESMSIDRKDPKIGYFKGNLQPLSLSDNTKKMHSDNGDDCPF